MATLASPPSESQILRLARRYRPVERVTAEFTGGANHLAYCLDDAFVLKVTRPGQDATPLRNEVVLLQALDELTTIPRPQLLGHELGEDLPHALLTLATGTPLLDLADSWPHRKPAMSSLATALRTLHSVDASAVDLRPVYDASRYLARLTAGALDRLRAERHLSEGQLKHVERRCQAVLRFLSGAAGAVIHADVRPPHLFFDSLTGSLTSVIDFADVLLGTPELEFVFMWQRWWDGRDDVQALFDAYFGSPDSPALRIASEDLRLIGAMCRAGHPVPERGAAAMAEVLATAGGATGQ